MIGLPNYIQDGEGGKNVPTTSFYSVTFTYVGLAFKTLAISFNPFATMVYSFKSTPYASLKLLNLNQGQPSKNCFFLVKSLFNWVDDNFSHRNARASKLESRGKILLVAS